MKNNAYNYLSCIGNEATIITGDGKGPKVLSPAPTAASNTSLCTLTPLSWTPSTSGTKSMSKPWTGPQTAGLPRNHRENLDPDLLDKLNIEEKSGKLIVPVAKRCPPRSWVPALAPTPPTKAITTSACLTMPRWRNMACGICGWGYRSPGGLRQHPRTQLPQRRLHHRCGSPQRLPHHGPRPRCHHPLLTSKPHC